MFLDPLWQNPAAAPAPTPPVVPPPQHGILEYFACTGFVGPVLLLLGGIAAAIAWRRGRDLQLATMAPETLQRSLATAMQQGQVDQAYALARGSATTLGELVAAGLLLRQQGLDEMLANCERAAIKESLQRQARVVAMSRLGTAILLMALFGTVTSLMSTMSMLSILKQPLVSDFTTGIGESLASTAIGLLFALVCYWVYGVLSARAVTRLLHVRQIAEELLAAAIARPK